VTDSLLVTFCFPGEVAVVEWEGAGSRVVTFGRGGGIHTYIVLHCLTLHLHVNLHVHLHLLYITVHSMTLQHITSHYIRTYMHAYIYRYMHIYIYQHIYIC
jgi:hypothetical protein